MLKTDYTKVTFRGLSKRENSYVVSNNRVDTFTRNFEDKEFENRVREQRRTGAGEPVKMLRRFRVLVSVSAALPVLQTADGGASGGSAETVFYNFRGTLDTANFLGHLFRTLSQVLHLTDPSGADSRYAQQATTTTTTTTTSAAKNPVKKEDDDKRRSQRKSGQREKVEERSRERERQTNEGDTKSSQTRRRRRKKSKGRRCSIIQYKVEGRNCLII